MEANGLPSRTSILTAAARALGSLEPDASVRNPDFLAAKLIGPSELALIGGHPIGHAFDRDFQVVMQDSDIFGITWLMLVRTRHIDEMMQRAIRDGAKQLVILGAGFDTRAYRFAELLRDVMVFEVDYPSTQEYKKHRAEAALNSKPSNLVYASADFTRETLRDVLRRVGFRSDLKTYFICEGVSMYVPEAGMRDTLRTIAEESAPDSRLMLEYLNRGGLELMMKYPMGMIRNAIDWGEPFVFGVPDGQDKEFFGETGLELGETLKMGSPESVKRYAIKADGTYYGSHLEKVFQERREAAIKAMSETDRKQASEPPAASGYWLAELNVPAR